LDEVPVEDVLRFESELLDHLRRNTGILTTIRETNNLDDDTIAALEQEILKFKKVFLTGVGKPLASVGNESVEAIAEEEVDQEKIVKQKR
jgi:F-type H+-transporting ATPase subunit alpha